MNLGTLFTPPRLSRRREWAALIFAVVVDALQLPLTVVPAADQALDVVAAVVTTMLIGFHPLLLPTFVLELIPFADMLPTWTLCVLAVIVLRCRGSQVVDVESENVPPATASPPPSPPPAAIPPRIDTTN